MSSPGFSIAWIYKIRGKIVNLKNAFFCFFLLAGLFCYGADDTPRTSPYETDTVITAYEIRMKPDFSTNRVALVVDAKVENLSATPYTQLDIEICAVSSGSGMQIADLQIFVKQGADTIPLTATEKMAPDAGEDFYTPTVPIYQVELKNPLPPGELTQLVFQYTLKGFTPDRGLPIWGVNRDSSKPKAEHGELYLISDFRWLPLVYCPIRKGQFQNMPRPSWKLQIEYPAEYIAAVDGELLSRETKEPACLDRWRSIVGGSPHIFISNYAVAKVKNGPLNIEIYTPPVSSLQKCAEALADDIGNTLSRYFEIYGDPGGHTYRLVASHTNWGGHGNFMGQSIYYEYLERMNLKTVAHELAHTWWGTSFSSYGEGSKFLREAFAEFSAIWMMGELKGGNQFQREMSEYKSRLFGRALRRGQRQPLTPLIQQEGYDSQTIVNANYSKGPVVVNALRIQMGDDAFFAALKAFAEEYRDKNVTFSDFVVAMNRFSENKLDTYLDNLCRSTGFPSYVVKSFSSQEKNGKYETTVSIANEGEFGLRCPVGLVTEGDKVISSFEVDAQTTKELLFVTDSRVTDVIIDPEGIAFQAHPSQTNDEHVAAAREFMRPTPNPNISFGASFKNISAKAGIRRDYNTHSLYFEDFNRDGLLDIYFTTMGYRSHDGVSHANPNVLFSNQGGLVFAERSQEINLWLEEYTGDAAIADFNNDGAPDLIFGKLEMGEEPAKTFLFQSMPDGAYQEVTETLGLSGAMKTAAAWVDIDNDNDLDLVTVGGIYRNDGNEFKDVTGDSNLTFYSSAILLIPIDYNIDNRMDFVCIYLFAREPGKSIQIFQNCGDCHFEDITKEIGLGDAEISLSLGGGAPDVNNDGYPDLIIGNSLFINNKGKQFTIQKDAFPYDFPNRGVGCADFDNDGDLDLLYPSNEGHRLFSNLGNCRFEDVATVAGITDGVYIGRPICADFDNDGDVDVMMSEARFPGSEQEHLFENTGAEGNSLTIIPLTDRDGDATDSNTADDRTAVGARVEVTYNLASGDSVTMTRWITAGAQCMNAPIAYFGLGEATSAAVKVTFPDGSVVEVKDAAAGSRLTIRDTNE